jgi:hypothetical protein
MDANYIDRFGNKYFDEFDAYRHHFGTTLSLSDCKLRLAQQKLFMLVPSVQIAETATCSAEITGPSKFKLSV